MPAFVRLSVDSVTKLLFLLFIYIIIFFIFIDFFKLFSLPTHCLSFKGVLYGCPERGWRGFRDSCYLLVKDQVNWPLALKECHTQGAELASIDDDAEQNFVYSQLPRGKVVLTGSFSKDCLIYSLVHRWI